METDPQESIARWKKGMVNQKRDNAEFALFKDANHGIRLGEHSAGAVLFWQDFAPGYISLLKSWTAKNIK
jgi:hypothetical protein